MEKEVLKKYTNICMIIHLIESVTDLMEASMELYTKNISDLGIWKNRIQFLEKSCLGTSCWQEF